MIDFIIGDIVAINEDNIIIQNNGIGYKVFTSITSMLEVEVGDKGAQIYTQMYVRDDSVMIYGFITKEEMNMFNLLLKVGSIGPKSALNILSTINPTQIKVAIHNKDYDTLCKAPGIGKKTAQRMVLELKDKIGDLELTDIQKDEIKSKSLNDDEAIEALQALGYLKFEAEKAIRKLDTEQMGVEDIIKESLKILSKK